MSGMLGIQRPRDSADPVASATLWVIIAATALGLVFSLVLGGASLRDVVLKAAGGFLLLLGSYYAARTLTENRADRRVDQILKAIELTAHNSSAVRRGAARILISVAYDIGNASGGLEADRVAAIGSVLDAMRQQHPDDAPSEDEVAAVKSVARQVDARLSAGRREQSRSRFVKS